MRTAETDLGSIIKAARTNKGLTQEALAEKVGIGLRHMMGMENEGNLPSFEVLYKLIRELHIPPDLIFYPEKAVKDAQVEELIRMLYLCDERSLQVVYATAKSSLAGQLTE